MRPNHIDPRAIMMLRSLHPPQGTEHLVAALLAMQVRFMVVGGLGVQHYCPERVAADLDALIESSETNATGVAYALDKIGFTMLPKTVRLLFAPRPRPQQIRLHPTIPADILTEGEGFDFTVHWEQSERTNVLGTSVWVASPQLLITMKSSSTREKDAQNVPLLQSYLETKAAR